MTPWHDAGNAADIPPGEQRCTTVAGKAVVLFNVDGTFHAVRNLCPHAGLPLGDGERRGFVLTCPYHGYAYDIRSGRNIDWPHEEPPARVYPTRVEHGRIQIQIEQVAMNHETNQHERGPAPHHTPPDEDPGCDPNADDGADDNQPNCPTGYPHEETAPPQQPRPDHPKPLPSPSRQGH